MIVVTVRGSEKSDLVGMVWSTYYSVSVFAGGTQYSISKCLWCS